eukprot:sb/3478996/
MEVRETSNFTAKLRTSNFLLRAVCFARLRCERAQPTSVCLRPRWLCRQQCMQCTTHLLRIMSSTPEESSLFNPPPGITEGYSKERVVVAFLSRRSV